MYEFILGMRDLGVARSKIARMSAQNAQLQSKANKLLLPRAYFTILLLGALCAGLSAQVPTPQPDTSQQVPVQDTLPQKNFNISVDGLSVPVAYNAQDSMILDNMEQKAYLYGGAFIKYQDLTLTADYIELNLDSSIVTAQGVFYPGSKRMQGKPKFQKGDQEFTADRMRYNFQSEKGIIYDVITTQNDVVVQGGRSKFLVGEVDQFGERNNVINSSNTILTTCTLEEPHFGIRSSKQKVIPNKLVIIGPSQLEVMSVPTPIWLPFGFFPIKTGRSTGLIFPSDYEYSPNLGFGLRDVGWYFPLSEYFNLQLTANIYLKGTFGINARSDYRKRYKYSGNFDLGYDNRRIEQADATFLRQRSYRIRWSHRQERTAHPTNNFGGSINIQTNDYQSRVFNDANSVLQTTLNSNMTFTKSFPKATLTSTFNHSQNTQNGQVTVNFPNVSFQTQTLNPFESEQPGPRKWYEDIALRYDGEVRNRFQTQDTTLFTQQTLNDAQYGVEQNVSLNTSLKVLQYLNFNPAVNYTETWQFKSIRRNFDPSPTVELDTTFNADSTSFVVDRDTLAFGTVMQDTLTGFSSYRTYSASLGFNTRLFGTLRFRKGFLRGLRHEIRPSFSMSYSPDYIDPDRGYYREVMTDTRFPNQTQTYSIFENTLFGPPPRSGEQLALNYGFNNIFQAKVFSRKDSTEKNIKLIDNLRINGSYNFAADSLNWSPVSVNTTARFFKGATTLNFNARFDPYIENENGRTVNTTVWEDRGRLIRFDQASLRIASNLTVGKIRAIFQGKEEEVVRDRDQQQQRQRQRRSQPGGDFLSLFENFRIQHNISLDWSTTGEESEFEIRTNSINCRGNIDLTPNWAVRVGNFGYDFVRQDLSYPSVGFQRDLHCWELSLDWQPQRGTYSFNIRVKPGTLDFIKVPYQRNNVDGQNAFR